MKKTYQVKFLESMWEHVYKDEKDFLYTCKKWAGKYGTITIDISNQKTNKENRYFRGVVIPHFLKAIREAGYNEIVTEQDALDLIKGLFFKAEPLKIGKKEYPRYLSTSNSNWNTIDWEGKMDAIRDFAQSKLNYIIPLPNEG